MKKKSLLFALLALAIVSSLTAGTLAIYTKSVDLKGNIEIKKFAFGATGGVANDATAIKLAPQESQNYNFTINNFEADGAPSEVPLNYTIAIDFSNAATTMPGLKASLKTNGTEVATDTSGIITYTAAKSEASVKTSLDYVLTLTWGGTDDAGHTDAGLAQSATEGLKIDITATQAI